MKWYDIFTDAVKDEVVAALGREEYAERKDLPALLGIMQNGEIFLSVAENFSTERYHETVVGQPGYIKDAITRISLDKEVYTLLAEQGEKINFPRNPEQIGREVNKIIRMIGRTHLVEVNWNGHRKLEKFRTIE